jgi:hypothetical protein
MIMRVSFKKEFKKHFGASPPAHPVIVKALQELALLLEPAKAPAAVWVLSKRWFKIFLDAVVS